MRDVENVQEWSASAGLETPFAEALDESSAGTPGESPAVSWGETVSPFAEAISGEEPQSETDRLVAEAFAELRDESFDEALTFLEEETERDVSDRFVGESTSFLAERERFADSRLAEVRYEAEQYLERLEEALTGLDVESLAEDQLDEVMERYDPQPGNLTPAGEEFVGALVKKAKKAVKHVVNAAKVIGKIANPLMGPLLKQLRKLVNPLLRRVLSFAIGRLPPPLQPAARKLATRFTSEAEEEGAEEAGMSPANLTDVEALAEQFDVALAEAMAGDFTGELELESEEGEYAGEAEGGQQLLTLAEARGILIDRLRRANGEENLAPAIEQFVPAILGALRLGISLIGRPKVVNFLSGYLAKLIGKWVEPQESSALSRAIVDTGMRLVSLEAEDNEGEAGDTEAAPVALAAVVEDTVRRLSEHEEYVFEDEDLMQLAAADSFSQAVATHFPPSLVRAELQRAPSLGGTFVARRPRGIRTYRKYSRVPTIEVTPQIADRLPTFGGSTVGAAMRAAGISLPTRARMHIFQAAPGTSLSAIGRIDREAGGRRGAIPARSFHPLTPRAAGVLLREPALGAPVPSAYLRTPNRIAAGQRFYVLQPVGGSAAHPGSSTTAGRAAAGRLSPSRSWLSFNYRQGRVTVGVFFSEVEAQQIAEALRKGQGTAPLLKAIVQACQSIGLAGARRRVQQEEEDQEDFEDFVEGEEFARGISRKMPRSLARLLRRKIAAWVLPALASWVKTSSEEFIRAAGHPDSGVSIRARLTGVPGLNVIRQIATGAKGAGGLPDAIRALRGTPAIVITVTPGRRRK